MKYDAIIFDLDGTLLNTIGDLTDSVNEALRAQKFPTKTEEEVQARVGNGIGRLVQQSVPENTPRDIIDLCFADFTRAYEERMMVRTRPYEGIVNLLYRLQEKKVRVGVLSNKFDAAAKALVSYYFGELCHQTIGEIKGLPRKPDPVLAHKLMEELQMNPARTLYVGDSDTDMKTAKNAGLTAVGVSWGFREEALLRTHGADVIVHEPEDILALCEHGISENNA